MGCFWGVHAIESFQVERIAHADDRWLTVLIVNKINLCTNVYCTINSDVNGNVCVCVRLWIPINFYCDIGMPITPNSTGI